MQNLSKAIRRAGTRAEYRSLFDPFYIGHVRSIKKLGLTRRHPEPSTRRQATSDIFTNTTSISFIEFPAQAPPWSGAP